MTSSFDIAYEITIKQEGGLVNDPSDKGGITNGGISLRFLKSCGLKYDFNNDGIVNDKEIINLTEDQKKIIYKNEFFNKLSCELINNQSIINYLFDTAVNCGINTAVKIVQKALCSYFNTVEIKIDGIIGPQTLTLINKSDINLIIPMRSERANYYRNIVNNNPKMNKYINGWLRRAYTLYVG